MSFAQASKTESIVLPAEGFPIDAALRKLAPNLARAASETAAGFFSRPASLAPAWEAPRIPDPGRIQCSQKNVGERYEMICNLTADASAWGSLFPDGTDARMRMDAYCELANCICGALLADPGFADWFGHLIPCVPCSGLGCAGEGAHAVKGALRLGGTWILFSFAVRDADAAARVDRLTAAA